MPCIIEKCFSIMKKKLNNIIFIDNTNVLEYISNLENCDYIQHIAQKVDYYRAKLLYENGGMWIDADTIVLRNFDDLICKFINTDFDLGCSITELNQNTPNVNIQYILAKKNSSICKEWYLQQEKKIKNKEELKWADLGGFLLGNIIKNQNLKNKIMPILNDFRFTLGYKNFEKYYSTDQEFINETKLTIKKNNPYIISLYGTVMYKKDFEEKSLLNNLFELE